MKLIPCPACEHRVSQEAPFCPSCGHPIAQAVVTVTETTVENPEPVGEICHDCSAPAAHKCRACGTFCCVRHAELRSGKYTTGYYCPPCDEERTRVSNTFSAGCMIFTVLLFILVITVLSLM